LDGLLRVLSIIVPVLNEAQGIVKVVKSLQPFRQRGCQLIVVDGGSDDETASLAQPYADKLLHSQAGRANQMNRGAEVAEGELLLFLHADSFLPDAAEQLIEHGLKESGKEWGRFDVRLSGQQPLLRVVETMMNLRSRWSGIATGDQAIFVEKKLFERLGGFPAIALMEDIALSRLLKKHSSPLCLKQIVETSSRRWEEKGIMRTIFLMWRLRLAYFLGVKPEQLLKAYYGK
jgi:rSAM/selenodomain-associated transferase 2